MDPYHEEMGNFDAEESEVYEVTKEEEFNMMYLMSELLDSWMEAHGLELLERYYDHKKTIGKKKPQLQRENAFYKLPTNG